MTLNELKYIVAVAKEKHVRKASETCFVSQPTLSVAIKKLEDELDIKLFERRKQDVLVTPIGKQIISIAEETGLIIELDKWVMTTAMKQIQKWYQAGLVPGVLALNLSMRQLINDDLIQILQESMTAIDFKPEWLELEITEGQIMEKHEESIIKLEKSSNMVIKIANDDFGQGSSCLASLKRLPVEKLNM